MKPRFLISIFASLLFLLPCLIFLSHQPVAIVLPHHNLVQSTRVDFLKSIGHQRFLTRHIILIGPDHFSANQSQIVTSNIDWQLSTGLFLHKQLIDLPLDNARLKNDHTVYNPLADLKTYFPNADIQPILIGQKLSANNLQTLLASLQQSCRWDCLLVASVDFSHYLPATLANVHDASTLARLANQNFDDILTAEIDSPQSLYLLIRFSQFKNALKWNLFAHTNSGIIANNPDVETTTHVFGYYSSGQVFPDSTITVVHLPYPLDRSQNQLTLGDRFFYGVDKFIVDSPYPKTIVADIITPGKITKALLPLENSLFARGQAKQQVIDSILNPINSPSVVKDYFWGKLTYE